MNETIIQPRFPEVPGEVMTELEELCATAGASAPGSGSIIEKAVRYAEGLRSLGEGIRTGDLEDSETAARDSEWELTVYVDEAAGLGRSIACLGPGDVVLSAEWNPAGGIEWLSLGVGERLWSLRSTPDGEIETDSLNPEVMSGTGGEKALEYWESQQADAVASLAEKPRDRTWICEGCQWLNESGDLVCSECGAPAPQGVEHMPDENEGADNPRESIEPGAIPGMSPLRLPPGSSTDFLGRLGKGALGSIATITAAALAESREPEESSEKGEQPPVEPVGKTCVSCDKPLSESARFCSHCGAPQEKNCPSCGVICRPGSKFCVKCGTKLNPE